MITQQVVDKLNRETQEREAAEKATLEQDLKRVNESFQPFLDEQERERRQANEAQEAKQREAEERAEKELELETRQLFFGGTPGASEELYQNAREKFRNEVLLSRAQLAKERATQNRHAIYQF